MSINILHSPPSFQPVLTNGLFYTVSADTTDKYKFRYTYDVYVEDNLIFQGKSTPNPYDLGVVDISRILKTYCENNPIAVWNTTNIYTHQTFPFSRPYLNEVINYQTYFGYEYSNTETGSVTGFTGMSGLTGMTEGPPGVSTPLKKTFHSTMGVNARATQQDFDMDPFVLSGSPVGVNPTTTGLFLTNSPRTRNIQESEWYTLAFTNYYLDTSTISEPYYVEYNFYDDQGSLLDTVKIDNILSNGGGPRADCLDVYPALPLLIPSGGTNYNTLYVGSGPKNLDPILPVDTAKYTVQLFGKFTGETQPIQPSPTPTPTPSATPTYCSCEEYEIFNPSLEAQGIIFFDDCLGTPRTLVVNPGETFYICVCNIGSFTIQGPLIATNTGKCIPPVCICWSYTITNTGLEGQLTVDYIDCDSQFQSFTLDPGLGSSFCACKDSVTATGSSYSLIDGGSCGPTPTPTPTPSATPACNGVEWIVQECTGGPCVGGICFCESSVSTSIYLPPLVQPGDEGYFAYSDPCLTNIWYGFYEWSGSIYEASQITFVCNVGGPC